MMLLGGCERRLLPVDSDFDIGVPAIARTSFTVTFPVLTIAPSCSTRCIYTTRSYVTQTCERRLFPSMRFDVVVSGDAQHT
jgi:hypothetical protein